VPAVWDPAAGGGPVGQAVAVQQGDPVVRLGEDAGREQTGQAGADDDGVPAVGAYAAESTVGRPMLAVVGASELSRQLRREAAHHGRTS
jgi:hypothetical protein